MWNGLHIFMLGSDLLSDMGKVKLKKKKSSTTGISTWINRISFGQSKWPFTTQLHLWVYTMPKGLENKFVIRRTTFDRFVLMLYFGLWNLHSCVFTQLAILYHWCLKQKPGMLIWNLANLTSWLSFPRSWHQDEHRWCASEGDMGAPLFSQLLRLRVHASFRQLTQGRTSMVGGRSLCSSGYSFSAFPPATLNVLWQSRLGSLLLLPAVRRVAQIDTRHMGLRERRGVVQHMSICCYLSGWSPLAQLLLRGIQWWTLIASGCIRKELNPVSSLCFNCFLLFIFEHQETLECST